MKLFPNGGKIFEVISRYDDLLTLEGRADYEPGDTLALIVPFLLLRNITEEHIGRLAAQATLTGGAAELISRAQSQNWKVFCITTTYEQYAIHMGQRLGIYAHNIACTRFPLDKFFQTVDREDLDIVNAMEADIVTMRPVVDDERIKRTLDDFYWVKLPKTGLGEFMSEVKPVGGRRKVTALNRFAELHSRPISGWVVVGDSITDSRILETVEAAGGVAIAFNANEFALPYATMSLASTSIADLLPVLEAWQKGQRKLVERLVKEREKAGVLGDRGNFHWLSGRKDIDEIVALHKRIRRLVREEAGKLG